MIRVLALVCVLVAAVIPAAAEEVINRFDVGIDVQQNGDVQVEERIEIVAEHDQINRGIFRTLPRYYLLDGERLRFNYDIISVRRDGNKEPYETDADGNDYTLRIGDPDIRIARGPHTYEITYRVRNQVRYLDDADEFYWNVTGTQSPFPIRQASARVTFPGEVGILRQSGYTGPQGSTTSDYSYSREGSTHVFETSAPLGPYEGLTVAMAVEKGVIDPPSAGDKRALWWQRHGSLAVLLASLIGVFVFLYRSWNRVGRDPARGPVFALYEPPAGYSPAACHHIYLRGFDDHDALISTLVNLGIKGRLDIDAEDKKNTVLTPKQVSAAPRLPAEEWTLYRKLFSGSDPVTLGKSYDKGFTAAYQAFRKKVSDKFGSDYFRWNLGYTLVAIALSAIAIIFAIVHATNWNNWLTGLVIAIAAMNGLFMYLMPAATQKGEDVRTKIKGFRLYMETAEKLQLNAAEVGGDQPPPMTKERYETFLPYAIALGVEKPWTKHFESVLPQEAADYNPGWSAAHMGRGSVASLNKAVTANVAAAVAASMPQSSSSSGSGGGGFSGGGGGGGGVGGW
ncbi:DUF2207 domain-containing protein [Henriciella barbarensis]|uniref:DUF2207 domain-containing protein n=1 Tax=Henriciella barbarensis TaxID=86342 RepID=A0A399QYC0_9PROT|nr:DUF2207 domain-containing protein [Henriciella barbarensis]RIJ23511.1 DUF2207 domain-containing protein [Henriciella barbarensis]